MITRTLVKANTYRDSVSLMTISNKVSSAEGVQQAFVAMGTEMNKGVLESLDLLDDTLRHAGTGDLMVVVVADTEEAVEAALETADAHIARRGEQSSGTTQRVYRTVRSAAADLPEADLVVVSVGGEFAVREAHQALESGLHVMMFSDNVPLEDELVLKRIAHEKGLLMMGPDCGTAIINGVGLCFANAVRRGTIGIVGASGTGSQELSVRIHDFGAGVSQLIGTGGRDLSEAVGGTMMLDGLQALVDDPGTEVIVLVSKPPAPSVEARVLEQVKRSPKPVVVCFIGGSEETVVEAGATFAKTTKLAALEAVKLTGVKEEDLDLHALNWPLIEEVRAKLGPEQRYIRGLFCGGTLCDEAMYLAMEKFADVQSNIHPDPARRLDAHAASSGHTFLDFGDDAFTQGKPHPMIDPSTRIARLLAEAKDPEVGVLVLDFILGFGAHEDPVGVMLPAITQAKEQAAAEGRHLEVLGYVLGTDLDTPSLTEQVAKLESAGVTIASSSANTGLLAREFVSKES
jgi:succinyl-CoA synthetase alpha subunit